MESKMVKNRARFPKKCVDCDFSVGAKGRCKICRAWLCSDCKQKNWNMCKICYLEETWGKNE